MSAIPTGTYDLDASHSEVGFSVRHAGISKVRGRFTEVSGSIVVAEPFTDSRVDVEIGAGSVTTNNAQRDGHLVSSDFWDAATNPSWSFVSSSIEGAGEQFVVHGDLTINGVTRQVALETEFTGTGPGPAGAPIVGFETKTEISRKDYGLTWNAVLEGGGVMVSDKVAITIEVEGVKQG